MPFYEAVEVSQLLDLLAHDKEAEVRVAVTELLLSSYIPSEEEGSAFVMALLQQHPRAARAFCKCAAEAGCEAATVGRIAYELVTHLIYASGDPRRGARRKRRGEDSGEDAEEEMAEKQTAMESEVWCHVMGGISSLAQSLLEERKGSVAAVEARREAILSALERLDADHGGSALHTLHALAPSAEGRAIVIHLAAQVPLDCCGSKLVRHCKSLCSVARGKGVGFRAGLRRMDAEVAAALQALCCWGLGGDVIETVAALLDAAPTSFPLPRAERAVSPGGGVTPDAKRQCKRAGAADGSNLLPLSCATEYLACVLASEEAREILLQDEAPKCEALLEQLRAFTMDHMLAAAAAEEEEEGEEGGALSLSQLRLARECVLVLCKLALHLANATERPEVAATCLQAVSRRTLDLMDAISARGSDACKEAFVQVIEALTALSGDALLLDIFAGMVDFSEILGFSRRVNAFVMALDGASERGFEQQMRRHVGLLLSLLGSQTDLRQAGGAHVIEECAGIELCGTQDFDAVFKTLAERLVV